MSVKAKCSCLVVSLEDQDEESRVVVASATVLGLSVRFLSLLQLLLLWNGNNYIDLKCLEKVSLQQL